MEVRFTVDDDFIKKLQSSLNVKTTPEVTKSALTLLNWAVGEVSKGRVILSSTDSGDQVHRLAMPALDAAKKTPPEPTAQ